MSVLRVDIRDPNERLISKDKAVSDVAIPKVAFGNSLQISSWIDGDSTENQNPAYDSGSSKVSDASFFEIKITEILPGQSKKSLLSFTSRLLGNKQGILMPTCIWPQVGFDELVARNEIPDLQTPLWAGRRFKVECNLGELNFSEFEIASTYSQPIVYHSDREGRILNGFESGDSKIDGIHVSARGLPQENKDTVSRIYLVKHRALWRIGDPIEPIELLNGGVAKVKGESLADGRTVRIAASEDVPPGAYDIIIAFVDSKKKNGIDSLPEDEIHNKHVITRCVPGLIIRPHRSFVTAIRTNRTHKLLVLESFLRRQVPGPPYFVRSTAFDHRENVHAALVPKVSRDGATIVSFHIMPHELQQFEKQDSLELSHLERLGGNSHAVRLKAQPQTGAVGAFLLWPRAKEIKYRRFAFDVVAKYSSIAGDSKSNSAFDFATCLVCGHLSPGLRIVRDPVSFQSYKKIGHYCYSDCSSAIEDRVNHPETKHSVGTLKNVEIRGIVAFPTKYWRASEPSQIWPKNKPLPLVLIAHGQRGAGEQLEDPGFDYLGYDYLINRLAHLGIIAASVHLDTNLQPMGRAHLLSRHIDVIKRRFVGHAEIGPIGLIGHSLSGNAVVTAFRLNIEGRFRKEGESAPHFHRIHAVMAIAPTDLKTGHHNSEGKIKEKKEFSEELKPHKLIEKGIPIPALLFAYGSLDADVKGNSTSSFNGTAFSLYDRAKDFDKCMVFIEGASHNRFNRELDLDRIPLGKTNEGNRNVDSDRLLSAAAHETIASAFASALFVPALRGGKWGYWLEFLAGGWIPPAIAGADDGDARIHVQAKMASDLTCRIADFEEEHPENWDTEGAILIHKIGKIRDLDRVSPHDTSGMLVRWIHNPSQQEQKPRLLFLRRAIKDSKANKEGWRIDCVHFSHLSFRVGQRAASSLNQSGLDQDLFVGLLHEDGTQYLVRVGCLASIPPPPPADSITTVRTSLNTIRIPLDLLGPSSDGIYQIKRVIFEFSASLGGEMWFDDIEFVADIKDLANSHLRSIEQPANSQRKGKK